MSYLARSGRVDVGGGGEKCSRQVKEKITLKEACIDHTYASFLNLTRKAETEAYIAYRKEINEKKIYHRNRNNYTQFLDIQNFLVFTSLIGARNVYLLYKSSSVWPYGPIAWL